MRVLTVEQAGGRYNISLRHGTDYWLLTLTVYSNTIITSTKSEEERETEGRRFNLSLCWISRHPHISISPVSIWSSCHARKQHKEATCKNQFFPGYLLACASAWHRRNTSWFQIVNALYMKYRIIVVVKCILCLALIKKVSTVDPSTPELAVLSREELEAQNILTFMIIGGLINLINSIVTNVSVASLYKARGPINFKKFFS